MSSPNVLPLAVEDRMRSLLMMGLVPALLAGCEFLPTACTLIGCVDALDVRFDRAPAGAYRVEVVVEGQEPRVFACADPAACPSARFDALVAERVTVRVITDAVTVTQQFRPRYVPQYPNGRRCGAACRVATVVVDMP